jgi:hypothetical protein
MLGGYTPTGRRLGVTPSPVDAVYSTPKGGLSFGTGGDVDSAQRRSDLKGRALGMMQMLAAASTEHEFPEGSRRDIITRGTADEAVLQIFALLDHLIRDVTGILEEAEVEREMALNAMLMLMALREYIRPLPDPHGDEELLADDLREIHRIIQEAQAVVDDYDED